MKAGSSKLERIAAFDAARALAALTGIFLHAALAYITFRNLIPWVPLQVKGNFAFDIIACFLKMFRSPLFFALAGYFAHMTYQNHGLAYLSRHRCISLVIPFVAIIFGYPALYYAYAYWQHNLVEMHAALGLMDHIDSLWFLYDLIGFYVVTIVLLLLWRWIPSQWRQKLSLDPWRAWSASLIVIVSIMALLTLPGGFTPTYIHFDPPLALPFYYYTFFVMGWLCHHRPELFQRLIRYPWTYCGFGALVFGAFVLTYFFIPHLQRIPMFFYGLGSWLWTGTFLSLALRFIHQENRLLRYLADSAYWIYISQIPMIMGMQLAFQNSNHSDWVQYAWVCLISTSYCLITYQLFVRKTWIGAILRGGRRLKSHRKNTKRQPAVLI